MMIFRYIAALLLLLLTGCNEEDASQIKSIFMTKVNLEDIDRIKSTLNAYHGNAVVIDVKDDRGRIVEGLDVPSYKVSRIPRTSDIKEVVEELKNNKIYPIARVICFMSKDQSDWCIKSPDGSVWKDKGNLLWLEFENPEVWKYLKDICVSSIRAGFKEVQLDYVRFSTTLPFLNEGSDERIVNMNKFIKYIADAVHNAGGKLSVCVFGCTIDKSCDMGKDTPLTKKSSRILGQSYVDIAKLADAICPMIYPSHFQKGTPSGIEEPDLHPYETVSEALRLSNVMLEKHGIKNSIVRPYLQAFTATWLKSHREYGVSEIKEQIEAARKRGISQWGLFNMHAQYGM